VGRPRETTEIHTRLLKCALEVEDSRAYWAHMGKAHSANAQQAFEGYWFGAKSLARVEVLVTNMRARFDAYPSSLDALHRWPAAAMSPETRRTICHFHLQLSDPLYRLFTGEYLVSRREEGRAEVTRDGVVGWVGQQGPGRWTMSTRIQFASKLLSSAFAAGLLAASRDPRPVVVPRVPDDAVEYLMYLLREVEFEGTLLQNPYAASIGLSGRELEERLRGLRGLAYARQSDLRDLGFRHANLGAWADARFSSQGELTFGGTP
jgi:hypothetical protein